MYHIVDNSVGKTRQDARRDRAYQTRNSAAAQRVKTPYTPLAITKEDERWFAECQAKATEVCMIMMECQLTK